jgi:hypothetical protein
MTPGSRTTTLLRASCLIMTLLCAQIALAANGPQVVAMSPAPGSTVAPPSSITVTLSAAPSAASLAGAVLLVAAGPDAQLGTADDIVISPASVSVAGNVVTLDLTGVTLPNGSYQLTLNGNIGAGTRSPSAAT